MSIEKYEETLPVEEMVEKAVKAMNGLILRIPGLKWELVFLHLTENAIPAATLKMQPIHRPTVPSALHFLRRSAKENVSFAQSAL